MINIFKIRFVLAKSILNFLSQKSSKLTPPPYTIKGTPSLNDICISKHKRLMIDSFQYSIIYVKYFDKYDFLLCVSCWICLDGNPSWFDAKWLIVVSQQNWKKKISSLAKPCFSFIKTIITYFLAFSQKLSIFYLFFKVHFRHSLILLVGFQLHVVFASELSAINHSIIHLIHLSLTLIKFSRWRVINHQHFIKYISFHSLYDEKL